MNLFSISSLISLLKNNASKSDQCNKYAVAIVLRNKIISIGHNYHSCHRTIYKDCILQT